jgi:hypothetical protein
MKARVGSQRRSVARNKIEIRNGWQFVRDGGMSSFNGYLCKMWHFDSDESTEPFGRYLWKVLQVYPGATQ